MTARTSLTRFAAAMRDPDPEGPRRAAQRLWRECGIAVFMPGDLHGLDGEFVAAAANRIHGRRG